MSGGRKVRGALCLLALALAGGLPAAGCVSETKQSPAPVGREAAARPAPAPARPAVVANQATDPCANRLHDISGAMLSYYGLNKRLPETLDELAPLADTMTEFSTECPVSHQPYVYVPHGLQAQSQERLLVLYDPTPAHAGLRWGVFIAPPRGGQLPSTYVLLMNEEVFRSYVR